MYYPNTADQRRISNSNAKTLIQNWVEERAVKDYDEIPEECVQKGQTIAKYFKDGHPGLINPVFKKDNVATTYHDDFIRRSNYDPNGEAKGIRYKLTEAALTKELLEKLDQEQDNDYCDESTKFVSEHHEQYQVPGFVHRPPPPTTKHDVYSEMPVSYWTEKRNRVHGVTQMKTYDSPFRKNAAFSTPGSDVYDQQVKPGELENYPFFSQKSLNSGAIM